jgi:hypothetical protein
MSNLELWDAVKATDPDYTKKVSFGRSFTSISPQYQIMKATEQFGPYGSGWGFESCDMDFSQSESLGLVLVKAVFFFVQNDKRSTFPVNNSWPLKQSPKPDAKIDPDFVKKAETNTMSKALSKLGFSADVFMGEFDNPDYVQEIGNEFALEKAEDKIEEKAKQEAEWSEWVASAITTIETAVTLNELKGVFNGAVRKANLHKSPEAVLRFTAAKNFRKTELENSND